MADAPLLFGREGDRDESLDEWSWEVGPWAVAISRPIDMWVARIWLDGNSRCAFESKRYVRRASALRALERELTRLAAGLDAMGVPRAR